MNTNRNVRDRETRRLNSKLNRSEQSAGVNETAPYTICFCVNKLHMGWCRLSCNRLMFTDTTDQCRTTANRCGGSRARSIGEGAGAGEGVSLGQGRC